MVCSACLQGDSGDAAAGHASCSLQRGLTHQIHLLFQRNPGAAHAEMQAMGQGCAAAACEARGPTSMHEQCIQ